MKAIVWSGEALGAKFDEIEIPAELKDQAVEYRQKLVEAAVELDDDAMGAYLDGQEPDDDTLAPSRPHCGAAARVPSGALRLGLQEQGRAAAPRRGRRLSAVAGRSRGDQGHRLQDRGRDRPPSDGRRSVLHARLQDHGRSLRRHDHLLPRLFGQGVERATRCSTRPATSKRARRPHAAHAREQPRGHQGSLRRRHRRAGRPQGYPHRRHALRSAASP